MADPEIDVRGKIEKFETGHIPIDSIGIRAKMKYSHHRALEVFKTGKGYKSFERGVEQLLLGDDYAKLPGFESKSALEIIRDLKEGSAMLDVGCGAGQLESEVVGRSWRDPINPSIKVFGFDANNWPGQEKLDGVVHGSIDELSRETFQDVSLGFDLIISSALLQHLLDPWGIILRETALLKPEGIILNSTMGRVIKKRENEQQQAISAENEDGDLLDNSPDNVEYIHGLNIFTIDGKIVSLKDTVKIFNENNLYFRLEYGLLEGKDGHVMLVGAQISGKRLSSEGNLNLSNLFYAREGKTNICYILAKNDIEKQQLEKAGYLSVQKRIFSEKFQDKKPEENLS